MSPNVYCVTTTPPHTTRHCPDCDLIGLGLANKMSESLPASSDKVDILGWRNNLAYAIDRQSWNKIKKCSKVCYPW